MATKDTFHQYNSTGFYWYPNRSQQYRQRQAELVEAQEYMWQTLPYFDAVTAAAWYTVFLEYEFLRTYFDGTPDAESPRYPLTQTEYLELREARLKDKDFGTVHRWQTDAPHVTGHTENYIAYSWYFTQWEYMREYAKQTPAQESIILNHAEALPEILADMENGLRAALLDLPKTALRTLHGMPPPNEWRRHFSLVLAACAKRAPRPGADMEAQTAAPAEGQAAGSDSPAADVNGITLQQILQIVDTWKTGSLAKGEDTIRNILKENSAPRRRVKGSRGFVYPKAVLNMLKKHYGVDQTPKT